MNHAVESLKPADQRLREAIEWLDAEKLNKRWPREHYDGLSRVYWLLRDIASLVSPQGEE